MKKIPVILMFPLLLTSCSAAYIKPNANLSQYEYAAFGEPETSLERPYIPYVASVLKKYGFKITEETGKANSLLCRLSITPLSTYGYKAEISLWNKKEKVLSVESKNQGFATLKEDGKNQAIRDLVFKVAMDFDGHLQVHMEGKQKRNPPHTVMTFEEFFIRMERGEFKK